MRIIPILFFALCYLFQISNAQESVKKELSLKTVSASMNKQVTNLILVHEDEREFEFPDFISQFDYFVFKNELKDHLLAIGIQEELYWDQIPILVCYNKNNVVLGLDTDHDNSFEGEEFFRASSMDSTFRINFIYKHKYDSSKDISIPVRLKVLLTEAFLRLTMQYDFFLNTDADGLDGSKNQINIFPFTGMARYEVESTEAGPTEIYFSDELIDINGIYWRVDSVDYPLQKIWFDSVGVVEKPIGYRVGQYLEESNLQKAFEELRIDQSQVDLSKDYTILHFWGEWCQPCLEEIPRLKKLLPRIDNEKTNVVHVNYLPETSDREKSLVFIDSLNLEGIHLLDDASTEYSLVRLLNNRAFPGYVIFDSDLKIVYRSDEKELNFPSFLSSIGVL